MRELLASLGLKSLGEAVGRTDLLHASDATDDHWKAGGMNTARLLHRPEPYPLSGEAHPSEPSPMRIDALLIDALDKALPARIDLAIGNADRSVGASLSGELVRRMGAERLPDHSLHARLTGSAGQSLGAFVVGGVTLEVIGDANDYVGKGLSGGCIIVRPPENVQRDAARNIIVGNTCLYGATAGEAFIAGQAGERFAVRNSGAVAVVEGIGDHGCEYMTGGSVVVLGKVGRNFAAGMSGGIALVHDPEGTFAAKCNTTSVELGPVEDGDALRDLVQRHAELTGSRNAGAMLENWSNALRQFVLVMPIEYRAALDKAAADRRELAA